MSNEHFQNCLQKNFKEQLEEQFKEQIKKRFKVYFQGHFEESPLLILIGKLSETL